MNKIRIFLLIIISMSIHSQVLSNQLINLRPAKDKQGVLRHDFLRYIIDLFKSDIFVETGTYAGQTTAHAAQIFKEVHTIELNERMFHAAKQNFASLAHVRCYQGESANVLRSLIPTLSGHVIYWLDAHYCGKGTSGNRMPTDLFNELNTIKDAGITNAILLIDDIRGFSEIEKTKDIKLIELFNKIKAINNEYICVVYGDMILAYTSKKLKPSPFLLACTESRLHEDDTYINSLLQAEEVIAQVQGIEKQALFNLTFPESGYYTFWQGLTLIHEGKYAPAISKLLRAKKNGFSHWRIDWYLANAYSKNGEKASARTCILNIININPYFTPAYTFLNTLY